MTKPFTMRRSTPRGGYAAERGRKRLLGALAVLAALLAAAALWVRLERTGALDRVAAGRPVRKSEILAAWEARDWDGVIAACSASAEAAPLDPFYLGFRGLASYYKAVDLPEGSERAALVDASIVSLRKALVAGGRAPVAQFQYVLGKAYFHKGAEYRDQSARYLESAIAGGYVGPDSREYLAVAYAGLGEKEKAVLNFEAALQRSRADTLLIAAARAYLDIAEAGKGEALLLEALAGSGDALARERARFTLAELYASRGEARRTEEQLLLAIEENPESAEARYRLGLEYQTRGDVVRARAEWRRATAIDPMHAAARQKLAEKP